MRIISEYVFLRDIDDMPEALRSVRVCEAANSPCKGRIARALGSVVPRVFHGNKADRGGLLRIQIIPETAGEYKTSGRNRILEIIDALR